MPTTNLRGSGGMLPQENLDFHIFLEQLWCILSTKFQWLYLLKPNCTQNIIIWGSRCHLYTFKVLYAVMHYNMPQRMDKLIVINLMHDVDHIWSMRTCWSKSLGYIITRWRNFPGPYATVLSVMAHLSAFCFSKCLKKKKLAIIFQILNVLWS